MQISLEYGFVILQMTNIGLDLILLLHFNYSCNDSLYKLNPKIVFHKSQTFKSVNLTILSQVAILNFVIISFQFVGFGEIEYVM